VDIAQIIILSLVQGVTEFLPVSSSAHLILIPIITGWTDQGMSFDLAAHLGTLIAVSIFFRDDLKKLIYAAPGIRKRDASFPDHKNLLHMLLMATIPVMIVGFFGQDLVRTELRDVHIIATSTVFFAIVLWAADVYGKRERDMFSLNSRDALLIGLAQAVALVPGVSRSGITISLALMLGFSREAASRFSFLLAIPVILAAVSLEFMTIVTSAREMHWGFLCLTTAVSAAAAYLCIAIFLSLIEKIGMLPFVIYRLLLGAALFVYLV
jgi:undecaprenyl-diphosphatase